MSKDIDSEYSGEEILSEVEEQKILNLLNRNDLTFERSSITIGNLFKISLSNSRQLCLYDLKNNKNNKLYISKEGHSQLMAAIDKQCRDNWQKEIKTLKEKFFNSLD